MSVMKGIRVRDRDTFVCTHYMWVLDTMLVNSITVLLLTVIYISVARILASVTGNHITIVDLALATIAVVISAIPVRNSMRALLDHLLQRKWQRTQDLLREIGFSLSHAIEQEALREVLIDDLPRRLQLGAATLWMLEPPDDLAFVALGMAKDDPGAVLLANGDSAHLVGCAVHYQTIPLVSNIKWAEPFRAQNLCIVLPLRIGKQLIGIYGCSTSVYGQKIPKHILDLLLTLSPAIASALENTRTHAKIARLNAELRALDNLRERFIESVGHELRTPLTTLSLSIQLLLTELQAPSTLACITHNSITHLQELVDRVLLFQEHTDTLLEEPDRNTLVDLRPLLDDLVMTYRPIAQAKGLHIVTELYDDLTVRGEATLLRRAIYEVVDNAVRYSRDGKVTITARFQDGLAIVRIADQGPGIPQEEQYRLFAAFYRGKNAQAMASTPGAGLGLSIARRDIEISGGRIWLEHSSPSGSVICLALPAVMLYDANEYERAISA